MGGVILDGAGTADFDSSSEDTLLLEPASGYFRTNRDDFFPIPWDSEEWQQLKLQLTESISTVTRLYTLAGEQLYLYYGKIIEKVHF